MADERFDWRTFQFREHFPWLHLFRGFEIARETKKILLGAAGELAMSLGWWAIVALWMPERPTEPTMPTGASADQVETFKRDVEAYKEQLARYHSLAEARRFPWERPVRAGEIDDMYSPLRKDGWTTGWQAPFALVLEPLRRLIYPVILMFQDAGNTFVGALLVLWTLVVWALFGGAMTRIAAVQVARDGQVGLVESVKFVLARPFGYLLAPILPFAGVVIIVLFCALGGLLTRIPGGNVLMGVLWFLALTAGFVCSIALFGLAMGWPLMYCAFGAEATDTFDALSRSYSYVLGRLWRYLFYALIAVLYGGLLMTGVVVLGYWLVHLSQYAVSWGAGSENVRAFYAYVPTAGGWRADFGPQAGEAVPEGTVSATASLVGFWTHVVFMAIVGFAYSYFWSAATIIYFLLRRDVDETEIEEVYMEEEEEEPFPTIAPTLTPPVDAPSHPGGTAAGSTPGGASGAAKPTGPITPGPTGSLPILEMPPGG